MTMKSVDLPHLRSVVLAGHAGGGKTTLAEQLLFNAGAIPRLGRVDDGSAHLDFEPEEQKRRESLSLAVGTFEHDGTRISLVDTPGYPDFVADMIEGFAAADGALFVMDASAGVGAGLEQAVALGRQDRDGGVLLHQQVRPGERRPDGGARCPAGAFGDKIAPLQIAIGAADSFDGHIDLVHRKAYKWNGSDEVEIPIPDELADEVAKRRDQLLAAAAEADDDVLVKYLDGEEVSDPELEACLRKGVKESILAPVLVGSAAKGIGLRALLDAIVRYLPSPADEAPVKAIDKGGAEVEIPADENGPLLVRVFKTTADPFVGRLTYLRVLSGTLRSQAHVWNTTPGPGRAHRTAPAVARQGPGGHRRAQGGRDRGRGEAGRDRDRRHARDEGAAAAAAPARVPSPVAVGRDRAGLQAGPRQDGARRSPGCSKRSRPPGWSARTPASRCSGRWARPTPR